MKHVCENNRPECNKYYDFSHDGIFLWTKDTCIGDEVFYSFLEARGLHEEFLSSFCKERTEQYRYCCPKSASFLSEDTFIACFFAWIANWDIDFRGTEAIDPFCGHNPEVLACDGVHVGVAVRFMAKSKPITKSELPHTKPIGARRFDRHRRARLALRERLVGGDAAERGAGGDDSAPGGSRRRLLIDVLR